MTVDLPKCSLIVLIAAKKVAERTSIFNFDACYTTYKQYNKNHEVPGLTLSKQVFLKLFVDLVHQGFLKSEGEPCDILNVNNKIGLGFRMKEIVQMIEDAKDRLFLPGAVLKWALHAA